MATDSNNKKILVVEDNEDSRRLVCKVLKLHGYSVIGVDNGEDAIIQAQNELPDLVLMDVRLPGGIDGLEATRSTLR